MDEKTQIDDAIHAHTQWFIKLRVAIDRGSSEFNPDVVKTDNNCIFGKWLYGDFPASKKGTVLYSEIKDLHAKFHAEAARILALAIAGQKDVALAGMETDSHIRQISAALMAKLNDLKKQF
jgi:hypothetical protein